MPVIRTVRPTDLVALVTFEGKALPNEAKTRNHLDREHSRLASVLEQLLTLDDRHTLVAAEGLAIRGLVSARSRSGRGAWEVEWLVLGNGENLEHLPAALLERLAEVAVEGGVSRIFLRLLRSSPLTESVRKAGFYCYGAEALYRRDALGEVADAEPPAGLRPRRKGDEHAIFRLYHAAVPQEVRAAEGMTLEEWEQTQDAAFGSQKEYVCERDDHLWAWLRVTRGGGGLQLQLLVHPTCEGELPGLVRYALGQGGPTEPVLALVPAFQVALKSILTLDWGFREAGEYHTLVRQLAVRVLEPSLAPARA